MTRARSIPVALPALVLLAVAGCNSPTGPGGVPYPPVALTEDARAISGASTSFGLELFASVREGAEDANLLVSPLSASMALGMVLNGAVGETYDAIRSTLALSSSDQAAINDAYRNLIDHLRGLDPDVEFRLANSVWYEQTFPVKQTFLDEVRGTFEAEARGLDFAAPASPGIISDWAEAETGGRIRDLVTAISPLEKLFLVNAVYFKAPWAQPFNEPSTRDRPFTTLDGAQIEVPTMSMDETLLNTTAGGVQAVELLYADSAYSMLILGPAPGGTPEDVDVALTPAGIDALVTAMSAGRIDLSLPRFRYEFDLSLRESLDSLGMGIAFRAFEADFTGIADVGDLHITRVKQKAFIDVHELGTEAAAATSVGVGVTSAPPRISFDSPFHYLIRERETGTILFIGRLGDPSQG